MKIAIIANQPPPFRIPVYEKVAQTPGIDFRAIFCSEREPNREWALPPLHFDHEFLRERIIRGGAGKFIHNNFDVIAALRRLSPDVVVTTGFNPTHLYAFAYALARGIIHVPMTDGTDVSEEALTGLHKMVRSFVYRHSHAFVAASEGGKRLYESYGISPDRCFLSCLCVDNDAYLLAPPMEEKTFDFIFVGRIVEEKNPVFALQVAEKCARQLNRKVKVLFVGSGEQEELVRQEAQSFPELVDAQFNGHAEQHELPALYHSARIFLFPTQADVWGVVANEACAAGLPVIVSPHAGVAGELVLDGQNGFVCELDTDLWADRATMLLRNPALYRRYCQRSRTVVGGYTFDSAASGLVNACSHALGIDMPGPDAGSQGREKAG